jgi:hypothetical protein
MDGAAGTEESLDGGADLDADRMGRNTGGENSTGSGI